MTSRRSIRTTLGLTMVGVIALSGVAPAGAAEPPPDRAEASVEQQVLDLLATSPTVPSSGDHQRVFEGTLTTRTDAHRTVSPLPEEICDALGDQFPDWLCSGDLIDPRTGTGPTNPVELVRPGAYAGTLIADLPSAAVKAELEVGCKVSGTAKPGAGTTWTGSCGFTVKFGPGKAPVAPALTSGEQTAEVPGWLGPALDLLNKVWDELDPDGGDGSGGSGGGDGIPGTPVPDCHVVVICE